MVRFQIPTTIESYNKPYSSSSVGDTELRPVRGRVVLLDDGGGAQFELFFKVAEVDVTHKFVIVHQVPAKKLSNKFRTERFTS